MVNHEVIVNLIAERSSEIFDWAGHRVRELVTMKYPPETRIIDVGAGQGKYRILLPEYEEVNAVEVFEQYVEQNRLRDIYRHVYVCDVVDFINYSHFADRVQDAVVIMGDVLEHLTREDAQVVVKQFCEYAAELIVVVPYEYPQDEEDGNVHQRHLQDDLTVEIMAKHYPELTLLDVEVRDFRPFKGIYRWRYSDGSGLDRTG
jgi:hypothetical protein